MGKKRQADLGDLVMVRHGEQEYPAYIVKDAAVEPDKIYIQWQDRGDRCYVDQDLILGAVVELAEMEGGGRRSSRRRVTATLSNSRAFAECDRNNPDEEEKEEEDAGGNPQKKKAKKNGTRIKQEPNNDDKTPPAGSPQPQPQPAGAMAKRRISFGENNNTNVGRRTPSRLGEVHIDDDASSGVSNLSGDDEILTHQYLVKGKKSYGRKPLNGSGKRPRFATVDEKKAHSLKKLAASKRKIGKADYSTRHKIRRVSMETEMARKQRNDSLPDDPFEFCPSPVVSNVAPKVAPSAVVTEAKPRSKGTQRKRTVPTPNALPMDRHESPRNKTKESSVETERRTEEIDGQDDDTSKQHDMSCTPKEKTTGSDTTDQDGGISDKEPALNVHVGHGGRGTCCTRKDKSSSAQKTLTSGDTQENKLVSVSTSVDSGREKGKGLGTAAAFLRKETSKEPPKESKDGPENGVEDLVTALVTTIASSEGYMDTFASKTADNETQKASTGNIPEQSLHPVDRTAEVTNCVVASSQKQRSKSPHSSEKGNGVICLSPVEPTEEPNQESRPMDNTRDDSADMKSMDDGIPRLNAIPPEARAEVETLKLPTRDGSSFNDEKPTSNRASPSNIPCAAKAPRKSGAAIPAPESTAQSVETNGLVAAPTTATETFQPMDDCMGTKSSSSSPRSNESNAALPVVDLQSNADPKALGCDDGLLQGCDNGAGLSSKQHGTPCCFEKPNAISKEVATTSEDVLAAHSGLQRVSPSVSPQVANPPIAKNPSPGLKETVAPESRKINDDHLQETVETKQTTVVESHQTNSDLHKETVHTEEAAALESYKTDGDQLHTVDTKATGRAQVQNSKDPPSPKSPESQDGEKRKADNSVQLPSKTDAHGDVTSTEGPAQGEPEPGVERNGDVNDATKSPPSAHLLQTSDRQQEYEPSTTEAHHRDGRKCDSVAGATQSAQCTGHVQTPPSKRETLAAKANHGTARNGDGSSAQSPHRTSHLQAPAPQRKISAAAESEDWAPPEQENETAADIDGNKSDSSSPSVEIISVASSGNTSHGHLFETIGRKRQPRNSAQERETFLLKASGSSDMTINQIIDAEERRQGRYFRPETRLKHYSELQRERERGAARTKKAAITKAVTKKDQRIEVHLGRNIQEDLHQLQSNIQRGHVQEVSLSTTDECDGEKLDVSCVARLCRRIPQLGLHLKLTPVPSGILNLPNLVKVSLFDCPGIQEAVTEMGSNSALKELLLWGKIHQESVLHLFQQLPTMKELEVCTVTVFGGADLNVLRIDRLTRLPKLKQLNVVVFGPTKNVRRGAGAILKALESNIAMESISIYGTEFDEDDVDFLDARVEGLFRRHKNMKTLNFFENIWEL